MDSGVVQLAPENGPPNHAIPPTSSPSSLHSLPGELQTMIAFRLPSAQDVFNLAWNSKSLYKTIGPANPLLWHHVRYRWERQFAQSGHVTWNELVLSGPDGSPVYYSIPEFDHTKPQWHYYKECLDILLGRHQDDVCQSCFVPWQEWRKTTGGRSVSCTIAWPYKLTKTMTSQYQEVEVYLEAQDVHVGGIFYKRLCQACIADISMPYIEAKGVDPAIVHQHNTAITLEEIRRFGEPEYGRGTPSGAYSGHHVDGLFQIMKESYNAWLTDTELISLEPRQQYIFHAEAKISSIREHMNAIDHSVGLLIEEYEAVYHPALENIFNLEDIKSSFYGFYTPFRDRDLFSATSPERNFGLPPRRASRTSTLMRRLQDVVDDYIEMRDLIPRKRLDTTRLACRELLMNYWGQTGRDGYALDDETFRTAEGLFAAFRKIFASKFENRAKPQDEEIWLKPKDEQLIVKGVVCPFCLPNVRTDQTDGRLILHEEVKFVVHVMTEHPQSLHSSWKQAVVFKIARLDNAEWQGNFDSTMYKSPEDTIYSAWFLNGKEFQSWEYDRF